MTRMPLPCGRSNRILASLPTTTLERVGARLVPMPLLAAQQLQSSGQPHDAVYFPLDALIVLSHTDEQGRSAGVAVAGCADLVGAGALLGATQSVHDANVVIDGDTLCVSRDALLDEMGGDARLRSLLLRYAHALMTQISFNSFCARVHGIEQRLIRWLLLAEERTPHDGLRLSQETLASVLGVRREAVSLAAGKLQKAGLIRYQRSRIVLFDRPRMEALACQCYREIRNEYARLFANPS